MTPMTPDADPIDVLLDWLMPEPGDELEFLTTFVGHSGQIVTSRGTSLEVPSAVTSMLFGFLDLYASKARRPHSRFAELQLRRLRDEGMPIPEILHRLSVHRTRDGFRVRRLQ